MATRDPSTRPRLRPPGRRRGTLYDAPRPPQGAVPPPPPPDGRREVSFLSGLNVLAGIWLIIAPWVLGYSRNDPKWNDVIFGALIAIYAFVRASGGFWDAWLSLINMLIGAWIFVAAFAIDSSTVASWNDIILGVIVFILAASSADATATMWPWRRDRRPPPV